MELQKVAADLERHGVALVGISYDSPEALLSFAKAKGIGFPLLSDQGSRVITELGLLDRDLDAHHQRFGIVTRDDQRGVAYPAVFVLDESGRVIGKRIEEHYRAREGAPGLLSAALGIESAPEGAVGRVAGPRVRIEAFADSATYVRWQRTRLHVVVESEPGWHVYGRPVPDGYTPLTVELAAVPEVEVGAARYPPTRPFRVEGLEERFEVTEGRAEVTIPVAVNVAPGRGAITLPLRVGYQACSDTECLPPAAVELEVRLEESPPA